MKYRSLSLDELNSLENEFVDFLVLNGITADDWVKMKDEDSDAASKMTELFSQVVWKGILRRIKFLDFKSQDSLKSFQCLEEKIILVGIDSLTLDLSSEKLMDDLNQINSADLKVYTTSKPYVYNRESEIYDMLGWGCEQSDGALFKSLCLLL